FSTREEKQKVKNIEDDSQKMELVNWSCCYTRRNRRYYCRRQFYLYPKCRISGKDLFREVDFRVYVLSVDTFYSTANMQDPFLKPERKLEKAPSTNEHLSNQSLNVMNIIRIWKWCEFNVEPLHEQETSCNAVVN
ncbi:hypothetical protein MTR67_005092, partial [Solanum verrucosum]